jgi:hypothetical protein
MDSIAVVILPNMVVMLPGLVVMLPGVVVMLPGFVVMEPANAVEASAIVSNEMQRIDWRRFISFLLVNRAFAGVWLGSTWGLCLGKLPSWTRPLINNRFVLVPISRLVPEPTPG